jgi:hypothetical protein
MQVRQDPRSELNMQHFGALRDMINARLQRIGTRHAQRQIHDFPWLFGALGEVPSRVMLVCENPSLTGVERADVHTITGGHPSIEDQWCGGPRSNCIKRLRPALCELGLKSTPPQRPGGWRCYITNVIKEADVVRDFTSRNKHAIAIEWADVLAWEFEQVVPTALFTFGDSATGLVRLLQDRSLIPRSPRPHKVMHYSNRGAGMTDDVVRATIAKNLRAGLTATVS